MIRLEEVRDIPVLSGLSHIDLLSLVQGAADLLVDRNEWLIREGSTCGFFIILSGRFETWKEVNGREERIADHYGYEAGEFVGEVPILLGTPSFASIRAAEPSRVMRLNPAQLRTLMLSSPSGGEMIMDTMTFRINRIKNYVHGSPVSRVQIFDPSSEDDCREIRKFLSMNGIEFETQTTARHSATSTAPATPPPSIFIDGKLIEGQPPSTRAVARALGFTTTPRQRAYDVAIIGAGPAGLAAAVSASSEGLRTIVIERAAPGGQAATSSRIENYPGFPGGLSGEELTTRTLRQAEKFNTEIVVTREVQRLYPLPDGHCVEMEGDERIVSRAVVLATGVEWRRLELKGIDRLLGKGVLYGASKTEASAVAGKEVFIVGGGNSAGQAAIFLSGYASNVTMVIRSSGLASSMSEYLVSRLRTTRNIHLKTLSEVVSLEGNGKLEAIFIQQAGEGPVRRAADALLLMIGAEAKTDWLPKEIQRDSKGFIVTGTDVSEFGNRSRQPFLLETSIPGIFCAGDVRHSSIKRVASSVGEGSMTICFVHQYLALEEAPVLSRHT